MISLVRKFIVLVLLISSFVLSGCGYRLASKNLNGGEGRTIAVPTFTNKTTTYRIEQRITEAVRQELIARGIPAAVAGEILSATDWPSLREALTAKMKDWNLRAPLQSRDAARLFRALLRLGYDESAIREEIEQLHEQQ